VSRKYFSRPIVLLQSSNMASSMGNGIVMVTIPWLVLSNTGLASAAGIVAALSALPALIVTPLVGYAVDRFGRRLVSIIADLASAVSVVAFPILAFFTELSFALILALAVLGAAIDPAGYTARKSIIPDAATASGVDRDTLNGIHEGLFALGWTIGPLVGALSIAAFGPINSFWIPGVLLIFAAVCILALRVGDAGQDARAGNSETQESFWREATQGFAALWRDPYLRTITIAMIFLAGVYLPTESLVLPFYFEATENALGLGIVISAMAAGGVFGAFSFGFLAKRLSYKAIARFVLIGTIVALIPMSLLPPLPVIAGFGFLLGLAWGPMQPLINSLVQTRVQPDVQGRVFSVQLSLFYAFPPIAMLITGFAIDGAGVEIVYPILAGLVTMGSILTLSTRAMRTLDQA
jgi:DHA3 family macrolide efflux protein-like MFS transporter